MRVRYDFVGHYVIYTTAINGAAYQSIHNRGGMTDEEAKRAFHREHAGEISILLKQKGTNENQITTDDSRLLRSLA